MAKIKQFFTSIMLKKANSGTIMVKDIATGVNGSGPLYLTKGGGICAGV